MKATLRKLKIPHNGNEFQLKNGQKGLILFLLLIPRRRVSGTAKVARVARRVWVGDAELGARQFGRNDATEEARRQDGRRAEGCRRTDQVVPH